MSVQNGERLATKQDLADMYQGILPYLGGMPEMLANKFSKGDLYSTDEKMIGQWIDGKPLYQKVVEFTITNSNAWTSYNHGISDIEKCVSMDCFAVYENNVYTVGLKHNDSFMNGSFGKTSVSVSSKNYSNYTARCILRYTKLTDTAISIGSDTDYSTEEKIVGTWIDGSPVYQRTLDLGDNYAITTADKTIGTYSYIKQLINAVYIVTASASNLYASTVTSAYMEGNTLHTLATQQWGGATNRYIYLNIQYTKTTSA